MLAPSEADKGLILKISEKLLSNTTFVKLSAKQSKGKLGKRYEQAGHRRGNPKDKEANEELFKQREKR